MCLLGQGRRGGVKDTSGPLDAVSFTLLMGGFTLCKYWNTPSKSRGMDKRIAWGRASCTELNMKHCKTARPLTHMCMCTHQLMVSQETCATSRVLIFLSFTQSPTLSVFIQLFCWTGTFSGVWSPSLHFLRSSAVQHHRSWLLDSCSSTALPKDSFKCSYVLSHKIKHAFAQRHTVGKTTALLLPQNVWRWHNLPVYFPFNLFLRQNLTFKRIWSSGTSCDDLWEGWYTVPAKNVKTNTLSKWKEMFI